MFILFIFFLEFLSVNMYTLYTEGFLFISFKGFFVSLFVCFEAEFHYIA